MAIDTAGGLVFHPKHSQNLLHIDMGDIGLDGTVQRRLAPVVDLDLRTQGAACQVKDRPEREVTVLQRQVRGHVVHGLVRNHHRGALEVQLGIHRPGQFQVKDRIWRTILTLSSLSAPGDGGWPEALVGMARSRTSKVREKSCASSNGRLPCTSRERPPARSLFPRVPVSSRTAQTSPSRVRWPASRYGVWSGAACPPCPWLPEGWSGNTRARDTSAATPCSCKGCATVPLRSPCH